MSNSYKLVNPYIKGEFETKISSKNSLEAAKQFYGALSEHFNNNVPKFYFTIQKGGAKKFYHFEVTETKNASEVDYSIKPFTIKNGDSAIEEYLDNFNAFKGRYNKKSSKKGSKNVVHLNVVQLNVAQLNVAQLNVVHQRKVPKNVVQLNVVQLNVVHHVEHHVVLQ